jgi:ribosomal protein L7/L12
MSNYLDGALPYYAGTALFAFFFVMLIVTGSMFARQKNSTSRPNEYLPDRLVFYPCGYTKKLKVNALIAFTGFLVILPTAIAYGIGWVFLDDKAWIPAVITFAVFFFILLIIARQPFCHKEACLVIDDQKVTVKYRDGELEDKVFYISKYDHYNNATKYVAPILVFSGYEGEEELSLHFLRINDAITVGKMVEFIKANGRIPVIQQVGSKQEAQQRIAEQHKAYVAAVAREQQELMNDGPRYTAYLEGVLAKIPEDRKARFAQLMKQNQKLQAIKECREFTGEGLKIAKDLIERYFE